LCYLDAVVKPIYKAGGLGARGDAMADVPPTSAALALDHSVSTDAALAWIHAAQTGVDGVLAADATNSVTVSQVMLAELNNHGFHLV
jgi:hypothetical protein